MNELRRYVLAQSLGKVGWSSLDLDEHSDGEVGILAVLRLVNERRWAEFPTALDLARHTLPLIPVTQESRAQVIFLLKLLMSVERIGEEESSETINRLLAFFPTKEDASHPEVRELNRDVLVYFTGILSSDARVRLFVEGKEEVLDQYETKLESVLSGVVKAAFAPTRIVRFFHSSLPSLSRRVQGSVIESGAMRDLVEAALLDGKAENAKRVLTNLTPGSENKLPPPPNFDEAFI